MIKLLNSVRPRSLVIACAASNVAHEMGMTIYITSGNDSTHMVKSKHYDNEALDFRTKNFPSEELINTFMVRLQHRLGPKYQVIREDAGKPNDHCHVEYEPA